MAMHIEEWRKATKQMIESHVSQHGKLRAKAYPGRAAILIKLLGINENHISAVYEIKGSVKTGHYLPGTRIPIDSRGRALHPRLDPTHPQSSLAPQAGGEGQPGESWLHWGCHRHKMITIRGSGFGLYGYLPAVIGHGVVLPLRYKDKLSQMPQARVLSDQVQWVADDQTAQEQADTIIIAIPPEHQPSVADARRWRCQTSTA